MFFLYTPHSIRLSTHPPIQQSNVGDDIDQSANNNTKDGKQDLRNDTGVFHIHHHVQVDGTHHPSYRQSKWHGRDERGKGAGASAQGSEIFGAAPFLKY